MPASERELARAEQHNLRRMSHKRRGKAVVEEEIALPAAAPIISAAQALDRITLPPEAVQRISALMSPGASLIVSDEGLGPETGEGTGFVVLTR
jgi:hypothetical protein